MSQKYSNNFTKNILTKLREADVLLIKEYSLFLSGKNSFFNSKLQLLNDINKYYIDLKESFDNEHKLKLNLIDSYFNNIEKEFESIDQLLQNNKRIVNKGINYMNILIKSNFLDVKLTDQLQLIDELNLNCLLNNNDNNKINLFLYKIKNNLLIPEIEIDNKVIKLVQQVHDSFSINIKDKSYNVTNPGIIDINNIIDEKKEENKSLTKNFINNNNIYLEEESQQLKALIEDLCTYINKIELSKNFLWFEPNSNNIYDISLNNNKINTSMVNYKYIGNTTINSFLFNEEFRVSNYANNTLYITGGKLNESNLLLNDVYEYSLSKKSLVQKSPMCQKRINHASIVIGNKLYVCGGVDENYNCINACEVLNLDNNKWSILSPMKEKLSKINLVEIDDKHFAAFGGIKENNIFNNIIHYYRIDTNTWFTLDDFFLPKGLIYPGLCKISSKCILILGGINENNEEDKEVYKMDITSGIIEKAKCNLDISGLCLYSCIHFNNEIHLLVNHNGQKYPNRTIYHL